MSYSCNCHCWIQQSSTNETHGILHNRHHDTVGRGRIGTFLEACPRCRKKPSGTPGVEISTLNRVVPKAADSHRPEILGEDVLLNCSLRVHSSPLLFKQIELILL